MSLTLCLQRPFTRGSSDDVISSNFSMSPKNNILMRLPWLVAELKISSKDKVLDLGCGQGRIFPRATASKYKSLIFRYAFQPLTLNSHSGISKLTLIIRQLYPCKKFDAVALYIPGDKTLYEYYIWY